MDCTDFKREFLGRIAQQNVPAESAIAIRTRHRDCLRRALEACEQARHSFDQGIAPEYIAVDLRAGLDAVGEIIGTVRRVGRYS